MMYFAITGHTKIALSTAAAENAQNRPWKPHHLMKNQTRITRVTCSMSAAQVKDRTQLPLQWESQHRILGFSSAT